MLPIDEDRNSCLWFHHSTPAVVNYTFYVAQPRQHQVGLTKMRALQQQQAGAVYLGSGVENGGRCDQTSLQNESETPCETASTMQYRA